MSDPVARLPFRASRAEYQRQADDLLTHWYAGDEAATKFFWQQHPRFRNEEVKWLPKNLSEAEVRSVTMNIAAARLAIARWYDFESWDALAEYVEAVTQDGSPVHRFEAAVEAVIDGEIGSLRSLLDADPDLVRARSTRIAPFDPPRHRAMLLHYVAANGVEGYRQRSPKNAVEVARLLLERGAEVDGLANLYGGECTTMSLLVSSTPPAQAGVQVPLVHTLIDFGAAVESRGAGAWTSPLLTALVFGFHDAAIALVSRGARVETLAVAAGLGRRDEARALLPSAPPDERHRALALAAQLGHAEVVRLLLDAGEDPNRYNPKGGHAHSTPLHQAALANHDAVVRLLVERGARLDIPDTIYKGTPLGWAKYAGHMEIADYLRAHGAK
ncbi:MAG TPA: ankyrin repeat domain-containing protein [Vicinamibacterales bacterium]|nr:ankyrin repeat domain-containing protein [Vicinamibacterales bacterium]